MMTSIQITIFMNISIFINFRSIVLFIDVLYDIYCYSKTNAVAKGNKFMINLLSSRYIFQSDSKII